MSREPLRRRRYAPEKAIVEITIAVLERAHDALVAEHPRLLGCGELESREERLARAMLADIERMARTAWRYLEYVNAVAEEPVVADGPDAKQLDMF